MLHQRNLTEQALPARLLAFALLLVVLACPAALAQDTLECATCGSRIARGYQIEGQVYCLDHYKSALPHCSHCGLEIHGDYRVVGIHAAPVCLRCAQSHPPCYLCAAPADAEKGGGLLPDGRPICGTDRAAAVFSEEEATKLFAQSIQEVKAALGLGLALKVPVKGVKLVDVAGLIAVSRGQYQKSTLMSGRVLGLTTLILKSKGQRRWTEPATVHLLSGVPAERMLTVCAHEYAHVWHAENHPNYAQTSPEMREGFAEWVAYKVSQHSRRQIQVAMLDYPSDGLYYEGLRKFLQIEREQGTSGALKYAITALKV